MGLRTSLHILQTAARQWSADRASEKGAALAYFTLFSIAPLLIIAIAIAGLVFGEKAAREAVEAELNRAVGHDAADAVQGMLTQTSSPRAGILTTIAGIATLGLGALSAFLHLRGALCRIWHLEPPGGGGFLAMILDYVIAIIMVLCCGGLLLVSLTASTVLAFLGRNYADQIPGGQWPWQVLEFVVSFSFITLLFAVIFRVLSARRIPWRLIWYGATVTSLLFTIGKTLIGFYLGCTGTASAYGAAGSLVVFMIWVYYSSQIVFFGSELIQARRILAAERSTTS